METEALMKLALETLSCSQKELALRLGVSPTQISKWKNGEHMSKEMEEKIRAMVNVGDKDPSFVECAGSLEAANKWEKLIRFLADAAIFNAETGYDTAPLEDDLELLCGNTFRVLGDMGVDLPETFPKELDDEPNESNEGDFWELIEENPYSSLIYKIFESFTDVYGFYIAYVYEVVFYDDDLWEEVGEDVDSRLLDLAASKINIDEVPRDLATKFREFKSRVKEEYTDWLNLVKRRAFRNGTPLRAELLDMVYKSHAELGEEAENESQGVNDSRLHPDIYMDELLRGMRVIHQALPAIMKKLDMDFQLDDSELRLN